MTTFESYSYEHAIMKSKSKGLKARMNVWRQNTSLMKHSYVYNYQSWEQHTKAYKSSICMLKHGNIMKNWLKRHGFDTTVGVSRDSYQNDITSERNNPLPRNTLAQNFHIRLMCLPLEAKRRQMEWPPTPQNHNTST